MDAEYVLDKMQPYEIKSYFDALEKKEKNDWEKLRILAYSIIRHKFKKNVSPKDILRYVWDDDLPKASKEEVSALKGKVKLIEELINGK